MKKTSETHNSAKVKGEPTTKKGVVTLILCENCEHSFSNCGLVLVKKGWQESKKSCEFCSYGEGFLFGLFNSKNARTEHKQ